jgi:type I restriction enzyme S subunit
MNGNEGMGTVAAAKEQTISNIYRWPIKRLSELAEFRNGVNYNKSSFGEGVKVVGVSNFQDYTKPKYDELEQINPDGIVTDRNILRCGDIVFVRSNGNRELIGRSLFIEQPPERITHSAFTIRLRFTSRDVYPKFYAYCFRTPIIRKGLTAFGGGTNISNLNQDILNALEVPFPPIPLQKRIAGILSAYDELIENSQSRIGVLEKMARGLYREWFVKFRFPGHESVPRVASSLGEIPDGWEVKTIQQFGTVVTGKTPSKANATFYGDDVPFVKTPDMHGNMFIINSTERLSTGGAESQANKTLPVGSICVSCIGTIGVVSITTELCQTNQQINAIVLNNRKHREFLFSFLQEAKQILENLGSNGATMGNVNKSKFESVPLVCPPEELLEQFNYLVEPMFTSILRLARQIHNLRRTRDLLLPRLLSGEQPINGGPI